MKALHTRKKTVGKEIGKKCCTVILYTAFIVLMILAISQKKNFFADEIYSYSLSNNLGRISLIFEDGVEYDTRELFRNYLTADAEHRFDFENVWYNQTKDVHPPFYYIFLHSFSSLFPETFSIWFAGAVNIIFAVLTLWLIRKMCRNLTENPWIEWAVTLSFVLSAGTLSAVTFFRMYIVGMFAVMSLSYPLMKALSGEKTDKKWYVLVALSTMMGALTHYYCTAFAVLISIVFAIILLIKRKFKTLTGFCMTQAISGVLSVVIFPGMIRHIFFGYRGNQAVDNLFTLSDYAQRLEVFFDFLNTQVFGGLLIPVLYAILLFVIGWLFFGKKKDAHAGVLACKYIMIFVSASLYFFLISKIAAFQKDRYIFPIYPLVLVGVLCFGFDVILGLIKSKAKYFVVYAFVGMLLFGTWQKVPWEYLYEDSVEFLEMAESHAGKKCVCIYEKNYQLSGLYKEVINYDSIIFLNYENMDLLKEIAIEDEELLVISVGVVEKFEYARKVMVEYPQLTAMKELGQSASGITYLLYSE